MTQGSGGEMKAGEIQAEKLAVFEAERPNLISLAYRMMGEKAAAEDIVQEAWILWAEKGDGSVRSPPAWLRTVTTRLAIDALRSARARREHYVGPWLPEPLIEDSAPSPEDVFTKARECELALLWAMERLSEEERAAFILREVFDAGYDELAKVLGKSEPACRKLVSRAKENVRKAKPRFVAEKAAHLEAVSRFVQACIAGDHQAALSLLAPDVMAVSDGGGKRRAALRVLRGAEEVAQVTIALAAKLENMPNPQLVRANGRTGFAILDGSEDDMLYSVSFDEGGRISWIYMMRNPDKLPTSALTALL